MCFLFGHKNTISFLISSWIKIYCVYQLTVIYVVMDIIRHEKKFIINPNHGYISVEIIILYNFYIPNKLYFRSMTK